MATVKNSEPNAVGPQEPAMPTPQKLPTVPEAGALSPDERAKRLQRNMAKLFRGMAATAPQRNDSLGPLWHECACDAEALCVEAGLVEKPAATPERPIELRDAPVSMLHAASGATSTELQTLHTLQQIAAGMAALGDRLANVERNTK